MTRFFIRLLGPFQATRDDQVVHVPSAKARALLAYLAAEPDRPHTREALAEMLWPGRPEGAARANLRHTLAVLRKALGPRPGDGSPREPLLWATRDTIQFNAEGDVWVDVTAFAQAAAAGMSAARLDLTRLEAAIDVYRGPFLADLSLPDSATYEEWALVQRERYSRQALNVLHRLAEGYEQLGELGRGLVHARRQLELEPWDEDAQRQVMRLLALDGQRDAALAQYEACRRVLAAELDVEPEAATTTLYQIIRDGREMPAPDLPPLHNLPTELAPFVGRERELAEIAARLADSGCRLLSLVGSGGSGKTRLAMEAAAAHLDAFEHGVYWVSLASLRSAEEVAPAIAQAVGLTFSPWAPRERQLRDYLRRKILLLVLDNVEHLLIEQAVDRPVPAGPVLGEAKGDSSTALFQGTRSAQKDRSAAALRPSFDEAAEAGGSGATRTMLEILSTAPGVQILTTSRVRLNVPGEVLLSVRGMDVPPPPSPGAEDRTGVLTPGEAQQYSAVALFVQSARRVQPDFELTGANLSAVARVCHLVGGMPLGLLLAASWTRLLTPVEIAAEITRGISAQVPGQGLDFLASEWREVPARQRSMRAVFDYSWSLLSEREQMVLASLSVFRGGCTREAAQQVAGASLRELSTLVDHSLLSRGLAQGGEHRRFEMHELLRQYAADKLTQAPGGGQAVRDRHSGYYASALRQWAADLKCARQVEAVAEMDVEFENARAAWLWAAKRGQIAHLQGTIDALDRYCYTRWQLQEGVRILEQGASHLSAAVSLDSEQDGTAARVWARVLAAQGDLLLPLDLDRSKQLCRQALDLLERPALAGQDTRPERAYALLAMGHAMRFGGEHEAAGRLAEQSAALYQALDDRFWTAFVLKLRGDTAGSLGHRDEQVRLNQQVLALAKDTGDRTMMGLSLNVLVSDATRRGDLERAESLGREAVEILEELGNRTWLGWSLLELGRVLVRRGRFEEARGLFARRQVIAEDLGNLGDVARTGVQVGNVEMHLGRYGRARSWGERVLALCRKEEDRHTMGQAQLLLGSVALAEGAYAEAKALAEKSVAALREGIRPRESGQLFVVLGPQTARKQALDVLALAVCKLGQPSAAQHTLCALGREVLTAGARMREYEEGLYAPRLCLLSVCSLLLADQGDLERSIDLYALAARYPFVAKSRWFEDVFGRHIAAVAVTLPSDVVSTAQARGRARDLGATVAELVAELASE